MDELSGQQLGQYQLYNVIGKGGMATVYRARQLSVGRDVAVKVLSPDLVGNEEFITRFEREARIIAGLQHPHILTVYDFGRSGRLVYLVMRLMGGGSLAKELKTTSRLTIPRVLALVGQIASALDYAHVRGIVHRDLKPTNVLLDEDGNSYLTDFGIAKLVADATVSGLTQPGSVMGTPSYMAPEQWRSEPVDGRTDIYALGIMTYQMLVGQVPFTAETPHGLMYLHLDREPTPVHTLIPSLPRSVDRVLARALAKDPHARFASAPDFAHALEHAMLAPDRFATDPPVRPGASDVYDRFAEHDLMSRQGEDGIERTVIPPDRPRRPADEPQRPASAQPTMPAAPAQPASSPAQQQTMRSPTSAGRPPTPTGPPPVSPLDQPAVRVEPQVRQPVSGATGRQPGSTPPTNFGPPTGQQTGYGQRPQTGPLPGTGPLGVTGRAMLQPGRAPADEPPRHAIEITGDNPIVGCLRVVMIVIIVLALFAGAVLVIALVLKGGNGGSPRDGSPVPATAPATLTVPPGIPPTLQLLAPQGEAAIQLGQTLPIQFAASSGSGVTRVELRRFGQVIDTRTFENQVDVQSTFDYFPDSTGLHFLEVMAWSGSTPGASAQVTVRVQP